MIGIDWRNYGYIIFRTESFIGFLSQKFIVYILGTCSYVLTGTDEGMKSTFGSTCHGAGRALSRAKSRRNLDWHEVLQELQDKGISIRVASPKLVMEEAPDSYKDVTDVVETCHMAGISKKCIKLRPIAVIKG